MAAPVPGQFHMRPPPLPPGWAELVGPGDQPYYFNLHTSESTYVRPLPTFPAMNLAAAPALSSKSPEDKPLVKTPVPGTDWIRVKTTQGNTFYSHKAENRNVWVIPDEIKEAAETLEVAERSTEKQEEEATRIETEQMKDQSAKETAERRVHDSVFRDPRDEWLDGLLIGNCDTDPGNWTWEARDKEEWKLVGGGLQQFHSHWYNRCYGSGLQGKFPYTLSLGSSEVVLPVLPKKTVDNTIVITRSYHETYYRMLDARKAMEGEGGVVLTGQPGVGKTLFLNFMLARLISAKQVVLLFAKSTLYLFFCGKVYEQLSCRFRGLPTRQKVRFPIWALIDADTLSQPSLIDHSDDIWPVQASSPQPIRWKAWKKQFGAVLIGMPVWNMRELMAGLPLCPRFENFGIELEHSLSPDKSADQPLSTRMLLLTDASAKAALSVIRKEPYGGVEKSKKVEIGKNDEDDEEVKDVEMSEDNEYDKEVERGEDDEDGGGDDEDVGMADEAGQPPRSLSLFRILVQNATKEFGFAPRDVYRGVFNLPAASQEHDEAVENLNYSELSSLVANFSKNRGLEGVSHRVVAVHPCPNRNGLDDWRIDFKSVRIGDKVVQSMRFAEKGELKKLYRELRTSSEGSILAGWIFEAIVHRLFIHGWWEPDGPMPQPLPMTSDGKSPPTFKYTPFAPPPSPTPPSPVRNEGRDAILVDFNGKLDDITLEENRYYMPIVTNNPLFDSFTIDRNRGKTAVISFFQVTVSKKHGGSAKGYPLIQRIIGRVQKLLRESDPKTAPKIAVTYFLVRPEDKDKSLQHIWKMPDGWDPKDCNKKTNAYRGEVFCLCVPTTVPQRAVLG